jgi:hypothetical protein
VGERDPVFGLASLRTKVETNEVKGNLLAARPRYVRERWGDDAIPAFLGRLSPETRAVVDRTILPFSWVPLSMLMEVDRAIVEGPMAGDATQMKHFGSAIARYDLPTIYKVLFKIGSPAFVMRRINIAYATYFKGGSMRGETPNAKAAIVRLATGALPLYMCRFGVPGWFQAAVELSGGKGVVSEETACVHDGADACRWDVRWE